MKKYKNIFLASVIFFLLTLFASAQKDDNLFKTLQKVEANEYVFSIPHKWKRIPQVEASSRDEKFEFTDIGLPHVINDAPLTAFFVLSKQSCDSIQVGFDFLINAFKSYPDRITPAGQDYTVDTISIASGERAFFISTHFYRRSKVSNFSLFELVAYSEKRKEAYLLTVTYRYKDPTYMAETEWRMKNYALQVFKSLELR